MYWPVRRCHMNELSCSARMPSAMPATANANVNSVLIRTPDSAGGAGGSASSLRCGMSSVVIESELVEHLNQSGNKHDDEDGREDAHHEWEEHLDRGLLRLFLG